MSMHWLVVADAGRVRIIAGDERLNKPELVAEYTDKHEGGPEKFAHHIAGDLDRGLREHKFERAILCAPAHFLGVLRSALSAQVGHVVVASVHHDWTTVPLNELPERVRKALPEDAGLPADVS
jgi:protein required for attachment to host cells